MDRYTLEYVNTRRAIKRDMARKENREARWNDPEVQRIEAERREMYAEAERDRIRSLMDQIPKLRSELHRDDRKRAVKEAELRSMIANLDELTRGEFPAAVEPENSEPIPQPEPIEVVDDVPRGRGRLRKSAE